MSEKVFTVAEANALIGVLGPVLEQLRDAQAVLDARHGELEEHAPGNGGGEPGVEFLGAMSDAGKAIAKLNEAGVVVRDPASGLIDFPAEREGQRIFLCWRIGEDAVDWWHPTTSGFADRRPL
ncbi:MAG: DUF2203 domain-containing protein [Actinomycetota bacterium]|nr:DUF2203 domain-containing protein [Actinomycetota bacterium]